MPRVCFLLVSLFLFVLSTQWVSSSSLVAQTIPQLHLPMVSVGSRAQVTTTATYTPTATLTQTPTQTATPSPTPTPTPGPTGEVVVVQSNLFTTTGELTSVYLVGEVQNNTNRHVETVEISAILREKGGAIVIGAQERVLVPRLKPGDLAPFQVVMLMPSPSLWDKYELTVNWSESAEPSVGLDVMEHEGYFGQFDSYRVRGLIRNQTEQVRESVRVVITIYNAAGQVIGADFAYTNPSTLQPGQAIPFDVEVFAWAGKPDRTLVAQHRTAAYSDEECCSCTLVLPHPSC